jgi:hypothetical protein
MSAHRKTTLVAVGGYVGGLLTMAFSGSLRG